MYLRMPNIYESKCEFPISLLQINEDYYYINNQFYPRKFNRTLCTLPNKKEFCLPFDWLFFWKYINNSNDITEWILFLEDDITLCPNIFQTIFSYIDNYNINHQCMFIKLGVGWSGNLVNSKLLPIMIRKISNYPIKMAHNWKKSGFNWWKSPDIWLENKLFKNKLCINNKSVIYHPSTKETKSSLNHIWEKPFICNKSLI